jgi:hypothetical protein
MNTFKLLVVLLSVALPLESLASGNSGTVPLRTGPNTTSSECSVREGRDCHFAFNDSTIGQAVNSKVFQVDARTAIACLAPMDTTTGGSGNVAGAVRFWKVVGTSNDGTQANSMVPAIASASTLTLGATIATNNDCFTMSTGRWWIEVTTITSTASHAIVVVTGSKE